MGFGHNYQRAGQELSFQPPSCQSHDFHRRGPDVHWGGANAGRQSPHCFLAGSRSQTEQQFGVGAHCSRNHAGHGENPAAPFQTYTRPMGSGQVLESHQGIWQVPYHTLMLVCACLVQTGDDYFLSVRPLCQIRRGTVVARASVFRVVPNTFDLQLRSRD
jgi:hypothetical protein